MRFQSIAARYLSTKPSEIKPNRLLIFALTSDNVCKAKALRQITIAAKSTPITSVEIQTETKPLNIRREKYTLKLFEKCARLQADRRKKYI
jgi:hypothetical protein